MSGNTALINGMINATIIEILATISVYLIDIILLNIVDTQKRKQMFWVVFAKIFVFNLIMTYIKYSQINESELNKIMFFANTIALVGLVAGMKIISQKSYLQIGITIIFNDAFTIATVLLPYLCGLLVWKSSEPVFVGNIIGLRAIVGIIIVVVISLLLLFVLSYLLRWIYKHILSEKIKWKTLWWMLIAIEYFYGNWGYARDDVIKGNVIVLYYVAAIIIGGVCLYELSLWMRKRKSRQIQQENHILSIENAVMKEYYETLEYQLEQTRKFRHDIDKHMTVIKEMLGTKEQGGEVIDYASNVQSEFKNLKQIEYCKNPVVNAILVNKARQCEEQGIKFDIDIARLELGSIKEIDLIAVLANVLDNAIEECGRIQSAEKQIELKCDVYAENLVIKVSNSTNKTEVNQDRVKTEKKDVYAHGVGLSIVKEVVEKYSGTLEISANGDMFEVVIVMNN